MSHLKNYRGATNYFIPSTDAYRDNHDRIFGKKQAEPEADKDPLAPECSHVWVNTGASAVHNGTCLKCGEQPGREAALPRPCEVP